jgi:YHS domain-containing protein
MTHSIRSAVVSGALLAGIIGIAAERIDAVNKNRSAVALQGYDAVAYHKQGRPVKGTPQFAHGWMGATWHFASAEARDAFAAAPDKYAPRYGGYCSWAVSRGYTADVDPEAWKIVDGRLYLNYSKGVQRKWEADIPGNIAKADQNWPGLHK